MVVVAVTGGKGGTGKTLVASFLAHMLSSRGEVLLVDVDADNPCTYTLVGLSPRPVREVVAFSPALDTSKCVLCGACAEVCPTGALAVVPGELLFIDTLCEGCGACLYACRYGAIREGSRVLGWIKSARRGRLELLVAEARPGERRTDEVAEEALREAARASGKYGWVVIDTPAGTGRVVKRSVEEADLVVLVTEPTRLGLHDLKRALKLVEGKRRMVVVNKYGVPGGVFDELAEYLAEKGIESVLTVPYSGCVQAVYVKGLRELEACPEVSSALVEVVEAVIGAVGTKNSRAREYRE